MSVTDPDAPPHLYNMKIRIALSLSLSGKLLYVRGKWETLHSRSISSHLDLFLLAPQRNSALILRSSDPKYQPRVKDRRAVNITSESIRGDICTVLHYVSVYFKKKKEKKGAMPGPHPSSVSNQNSQKGETRVMRGAIGLASKNNNKLIRSDGTPSLQGGQSARMTALRGMISVQEPKMNQRIANRKLRERH